MTGVEYVGPFQHHDVVLGGWSVPFLTATPFPGGNIALSLDRRFGLDLSVADAERIVPFIADCIAVALGFTCHPGVDGIEKPLPRTEYHRMHSIDLEGPS